MIFYSWYFPTTVKVKKKMKFLSLRQLKGMSVEDYQSRFLTLERFALGSFTSERESDLPSLYWVYMSTSFSCSTLIEVVMRALECKHAHESHHQAKGTTHTSGKGQKHWAQDQWGLQQQRRRTDGRVTVYAADGQQIQMFPWIDAVIPSLGSAQWRLSGVTDLEYKRHH